MARYNTTDRRLWLDRKFNELSESARYLWLYFLTGPDVTALPGVLVGGVGHFSETLKWSRRKFLKAVKELVDQKMVETDFDGRVVFVKNGIKYNQPTSPNIIIGWASLWDAVPECGLKTKIWYALKAAIARLGESLADAFEKNIDCPDCEITEKIGVFKKTDNKRAPKKSQQETGTLAGTLPGTLAGTLPGTLAESRNRNRNRNRNSININSPEPNSESRSDSGPAVPSLTMVAERVPETSKETQTAECDPKQPESEIKKPKPKVKQPDIDKDELNERELKAYEAICKDDTLASIVTRPAQLVRDMCQAAPGVDVALNVARAGGWLRSNPERMKKNGNRFLLSWVTRQQDRGGGYASGAGSGQRLRAPNAYPVQEGTMEDIEAVWRRSGVGEHVIYTSENQPSEEEVDRILKEELMKCGMWDEAKEEVR